MPRQIKSYTLCKRSETAGRFLHAFLRSVHHASSARLPRFTSVLRRSGAAPLQYRWAVSLRV